jgi:hypothetical protein
MATKQISGLDVFKSPTLFIMKVVGMTPLKYQAEFLEDNADKIIIVGGRQIGKSTMLSWKAVWKAFTHPKEDILIIAPTFRQAQIVYSKVYELCSSNEFLNKHLVKLTLSETRFDNGSIIRCLTAGREGSFARGFAASMIIFDEASLIPEEVFISLEPAMAVRGTQLILSGTPMGKRGRFFSVWENNFMRRNKKWSTYKIPTRDNPYVSKEFLEEERSIMTGEQFAQEYEAEFLENVGRFYPLELVLENASDYEYSLEGKKVEGQFFIGVDVARMGTDETAIVVIFVPKDRDHLKVEVSFAKTMSKADIVQVAREVSEIFTIVRAERVFIDQIGIGSGVLDLLKLNIGAKVTGVALEGKRREEAYNNLKVLMENRKLRLNENDRKMLYQFGGYTLKVGVTGAMRIVKDDSLHDDLVDALVLALFGLSMGYSFVPFEGFGDLFDMQSAYVKSTIMEGMSRRRIPII